MNKLFVLSGLTVALASLMPLVSSAGQYANFAVAICIPVNVAMSFADFNRLQSHWVGISQQVKVDRVVRF